MSSRAERRRNVARGGQARHEDHLLLGGGPVRVLFGTTLEESGVVSLSEFIGFPIGLYVDVFQEKGVTDSEKDGSRGGQARREDHFDFKEEQSEFLAV